MIEYQCCNPDYANSGVLELSNKAKRRIAKEELRNIVSKLQRDESYASLYEQVCKRLEDDVVNEEMGSFGQFRGGEK